MYQNNKIVSQNAYTKDCQRTIYFLKQVCENTTSVTFATASWTVYFISSRLAVKPLLSAMNQRNKTLWERILGRGCIRRIGIVLAICMHVSSGFDDMVYKVKRSKS